MTSEAEQLLEVPQNDFFNSYAVVKKEVDDALIAHNALYQIYDKHEKYFDGEVTMSLEKRKKLGVGWMDCWNYGKALAKIRQIVLMNQRTMRESLFLSSPKFKAYEKSDPKELYFLEDERLKSIVGEHITSALNDALQVDTRTNQMLIDMEYPAITFGYSVALTRDDDWMPEILHPRHIAFSRGTTVTEIRKWITFSDIAADDLYNIWATKRKELAQIDEDGDSGEKYHIASNYVLEGLEEALWLNYQQKYDANKNASGYKEWGDLVSDFGNKARYIIQNTSVISVAKLFNREIDGSLSEVWIAYNFDSSEVESASKLLFKKSHDKVHQDDAIVIVKDSGFTNNGKIHKLRGISKMAVEDGLRYDQTRNMVSNKAKMIGMPYIQTSGVSRNVANTIEVTQGFGILKDGTTFVDKQPSFDLSSHIELLRFAEGEYQGLTQDYDSDISSKLSSRPTKGEVAAVSGQSMSMEQAKATIKLSDYSKVVMMMLKGLCNAKMDEGSAGYKAQKVFFSNLTNKLSSFGVKTKDDVVKIINAIQYFPIDYYGMSLDTLRTMLTIAQSPESRIRIQRMMLIRMGVPYNEIELHFPYENTEYQSLEDTALVAIENNMFLTTDDVVYSDSHDPISHLDGHYKKADEVFEGVGSGALDVTQGFKWVSNILQHCELHLNRLRNHPFYNNRFESYSDVQRNLTRGAIRLMEMAEKEQKERARMEQEAQQAQGGIDPVQAAKIRELEFKAQSKAERDKFLTAVRMETKQAQQNFNNDLKVDQQQFNQRLKEEQAAQDRRINLLKAAQQQLL
jgi:hypothetical protein